jgi:hypothetical protein
MALPPPPLPDNRIHMCLPAIAGDTKTLLSFKAYINLSFTGILF